MQRQGETADDAAAVVIELGDTANEPPSPVRVEEPLGALWTRTMRERNALSKHTRRLLYDNVAAAVRDGAESAVILMSVQDADFAPCAKCRARVVEEARHGNTNNADINKGNSSCADAVIMPFISSDDGDIVVSPQHVHAHTRTWYAAEWAAAQQLRCSLRFVKLDAGEAPNWFSTRREQQGFVICVERSAAATTTQ